MSKALLIFSVLAIVFLSGCPAPNSDYQNTGQYDDPNTTYYNSGIQGQTQEACGDAGAGCCEWAGTDEYGVATARVYCNDGLECRTGICVESADYGNAGRPGNA